MGEGARVGVRQVEGEESEVEAEVEAEAEVEVGVMYASPRTT